MFGALLAAAAMGARGGDVVRILHPVPSEVATVTSPFSFTFDIDLGALPPHQREGVAAEPGRWALCRRVDRGRVEWCRPLLSTAVVPVTGLPQGRYSCSWEGARALGHSRGSADSKD